MNKKLFEQRLRSIAHYNKEEQDLTAALEVTQSTRNDIVASLVEFCPFQPGQILVKDDRIMKVVEVLSANSTYWKGHAIHYKLNIAHPGRDGGWGEPKTIQIDLDKCEDYRIIADTLQPATNE